MFGDKSTFAIEIGQTIDGTNNLFYLDIWVADKHVTCRDNIAYLQSVIVYADDDLKKPETNKQHHLKYFLGLSVPEIHRFILSTRDPDSENYDLEDDQLIPEFQILNWGPNTDNVFCFVIPHNDKTYITLEYLDDRQISEADIGKVFYAEISLSALHSTLDQFIEHSYAKLKHIIRKSPS